ncbi:MAG: hypothetical protein ACEQR6_02720, partial [Burkholderiaceae bacterium]
MQNHLSLLKRKTKSFLFLVASIIFSISTYAQVSTEQLAGLKYRMIGPHRAGRTVGISGVADQPNVFYIGVNNGGVWKTTDYGHT